MRPLELRLAHFGPYRDEAVLNFETLDRLFLVCGPTGAGKTTLFDALTFALYEKTPGTRGGLTDQLVSHHAPPGSVPLVSLRFALGPQEWRVTRQLKHRVPKVRGDGFRDQDAQVQLEKKVGASWEPVPGKKTEINQKLEDLLGLSAEEFAKIVVLPQGDFQRFLEASSNDREKMLQKLFPVEAYDRLVEALKVKAKAVEEERKRWEDRWQDLAARLGPGTDDRSGLEAAWAEADAKAREAAAAETAGAEALVTLRGLHADWKGLEAKRQDRAELETRKPRFEADRLRLDQARKARPLGADLDRQAAITAEGLSLRAQQDQHREALVRVEAGLASWAARAPETEAAERRWTEIQQALGALETQKAPWAEARNLEAGESRARAAEVQAEAGFRTAEAIRIRAELALPPPPVGPGWDESLGLLEAARTADAEARNRAAEAGRREALGAELAEAEARSDEAGTAAGQAETEARVWEQLAEAVKAAALAGSLVSGEACPVCGATDHPRPAAWPEASSEVPRRLETALADRETRRQALATARARCQSLAERLAELPVPEPGRALPGETGPALLAAQARVDTLGAWTKARDEARKALDAAGQAETLARETWQTTLRTREGWTLRRKALAETVTEDPTPRIAQLGAEAAALRKSLDEARRQTETLGREQGNLRTKVEGLETQLAAQREEFTRLQTSLKTAVSELGWSLEELKAARLDEAAFRKLEGALADFDRETHRINGEVGALEGKFPGGEPPVLEPLVRAAEALRNERTAWEAKAKDQEFALRERDRLEGELRAAAQGKDALEAAFQTLVPLARSLDGRNPLNLKLTTWVLVQALEQVARSASHRLASMSGGRYNLRVQSQGIDARKDWGLDLSVVDGYTGQERAVGTLSGGEKFMTSISLALGLADVIQERAGGLKLEAIFIDEGFGTLDDQSLDRAMAILHDLGKNRSVGIISHVADLRQRITSRVEVVKGKAGSTLRQV